MKKQSASRSAFFNPRVLIGFVLCSVGVLLTFAALSKSADQTPVAVATAQTPGTWAATGSMTSPRVSHTATLLPDGKVLVAGGRTTTNFAISSAELYDPATGLWIPTGSMTTARLAHTAILLPSGEVLVAGGYEDDGTLPPLASAELYDPNSGAWTPTGSMNTPRGSHMATLISGGPLSGMVLVGGGGAGAGVVLASAELYDPSTGVWSFTGSMTIARYFVQSSPTTLPDDSVLIVGGVTCCPVHYFNKAETYDSVTQQWTSTSSKTTLANEETVLLPDGKVFVAGGTTGTQENSHNVPDAELFDPSTGTWAATASMSIDRYAHRLTLLASGQVLVAGGSSGGWSNFNPLSSAEVYDSIAGTWFLTGSMTDARFGHTATLLPNGQVLVAGGYGVSLLLSSAELYTPPSANPVPLISQPLVPDAIAPGGTGFTLTVNGTGLVSGSVVNWNGSARATTFVSNSQLSASILASDIAIASTASVTVVNPSPGGGLSNVVLLPVSNASSSVSLDRSTYAAGTPASSSVLAEDFNKDGKFDLAVISLDAISILLGNGDGTFAPPVQYGAGNGPIYLTAGDFNGDGNVDLATADTVSLTISILLGNGDGTFQADVTYPGGALPLGITNGDFNGDGKLDLAVTEWFGSNTVAILLGNGDGTFQPLTEYATGLTPNLVITADFNQDGRLDLAVGNDFANTVSILLGNGDGTFQQHHDFATGPNNGGIVGADYNGDGRTDLAICNQTGNTVSILLGNGDGTFQVHVDYATAANPLLITQADLNADGILDLVTENGTSETISVLLGNGDGTFQAHTDSRIQSTALGVAAADFNDDGRLDIAGAQVVGTVTVFLQTTSVSLSDLSLRFGLQLVGTASTPQTVTLTNTGPIALNISSITASGDFLQRNNCGSSLPAGESCTIRVAFSPSDKGVRSGSVTITDDAANSPQTIALIGTGTVVQLSPMNVNFGNQRVGTISSPHSVTLTNTGSAPLHIQGIAISGHDFGDFIETTTCGSSLPANTSCAIQVRFAPSATGRRGTSLRVQDDGGGGTQDVNLRGTGIR
jgi:hypothetical protein